MHIYFGLPANFSGAEISDSRSSFGFIDLTSYISTFFAILIDKLETQFSKSIAFPLSLAAAKPLNCSLSTTV